MGDLRLTIETDRELGTREMAERFLHVLTRHQRFIPERFGAHEPLRSRYDPSDPDPLIQLWLGKAIQPDYWVGTVLLTRTKAVRYFGYVGWVRGQKKMNTVSITVPEKRVNPKTRDELLELGVDLFCTLGGQYGALCDQNEYVTKNKTGWWTDKRSGRPQGGEHWGYDRTKHLPGMYWANLFGPAYVDFFGEDRLRAAPAYAKEPLECTGWLILTGESPESWQEPEMIDTQERVVEHLGADAFFKLDDPERPTVAPKFRLVTTPGGRRGGVTIRPIALDYVATVEEARAFIRDALDLAGRLRRRFRHPERLDFSAESLKVIDALVRRHAAARSDEARRDLILELAAYYGEVVRRTLRGRWQLSDENGVTPVVGLPDDGTSEDPFVRVVKLLSDGAPLWDWYELVRKGGAKLLQ